jgi:hypothetical protein
MRGSALSRECCRILVRLSLSVRLGSMKKEVWTTTLDRYREDDLYEGIEDEDQNDIDNDSDL